MGNTFLYLDGESVITVTGSLRNSYIGVSIPQNGRAITSGYKANNPSADGSALFRSDNTQFGITQNGDEMALGTVATFNERSWDETHKQVITTGLAMLYFFDANGIGWKELNVLKDQEVVYVPICRYTSEFRYIVDPSGSVRVIFLNEDGTDGEEEDELFFEDGRLYSLLDDTSLTLARATAEQSQKYLESTDSWYGGSERKRGVGGVSNDNFKWGGSFPVNEKER